MVSRTTLALATGSFRFVSTCQLFFDDERRNNEVESLGELHPSQSSDSSTPSQSSSYHLQGVTFCMVHNGMDHRTFEKGLAEWRKRHPEEVVEDASGTAAIQDV